MCDQLTTQIAYTHYQSGWTNNESKFQFFTSEENLLNELYKLVQPYLQNKPSTMTIDGYVCHASFQPQPLEVGECPATTLPFKSFFFKHWNKMILFKEKYNNWPFIEIHANVNLWVKSTDCKTGISLPAHIFYRRLKPV